MGMTKIVKGLKAETARNGELIAHLGDQYLGKIVGIDDGGDYLVKVIKGSFKPSSPYLVDVYETHGHDAIPPLDKDVPACVE